MKQLLVLLLFLIALPFNQDRLAGQSSTAPLEDFTYAEYPPYDQQVWLRLHDGMAEKADTILVAKMPETADAVRALARRNRLGDAERTALRIVETHPEDIPHVFDALMLGVIRLRASDQPRLKEVMGTVADAARNRLPDLPRALAAEVTYSLIDVDNRLGRQSPSSLTKMMALAGEYAGTEAALNAEFRIALSSSNVQARISALDRLISRYPGTAIAARSLYQKGFDISHNLSVRNVDPTDRFMQLFDIVKELESGKYPPCEWTEQAASLIPGFAFEPKYAPENIPRLLEAYRAFVEKHPKLDEQNPLANGAGQIVTLTIRELYQVTGEGDRGVETELLNFEKQAPDPEAIRYVRALFYMGRMIGAAPAERARLAQQAADLLRGVHAHGRGLWARKSLATLASLYYWQEDYGKAREQYKTYVDSYPRTAYAWVAALRIGACDENLGRWQDALKSYTAAAAHYSAVPLAAVFGHGFAARAGEALGQYDLARAEYEKALDLWDDDFGERYIFYPRSEVEKPAVTVRVAQLAKTTAAPGGDLVERGRWLLQTGKQADAAALLEGFRKRYPRSDNAAEALYLAHKARLYEALDMANLESPNANETAAAAILERLAAQPFDFPVAAAKITLGCMLSKQGNAGRGEQLAMEALKQWQARPIPAEHPSALAKEVAEIRSVVFRPNGAPLYGGRMVNGPPWPPRQPSRFVVAESEVPVSFADGRSTRLTLDQTFPGLDNVLLFSSEQLTFFYDLITRLGGTKKRQPTAIMETPNQPIGNSTLVREFLNQFFQVVPGHWSGWVFSTYPQITRITFTDKEMTKARVAVTIGYAGGEVLMEKQNGRWKATAFTNTWVT